MPQQPAVNDDPIQEPAASAGVTYKSVTSRMVDELGKRVVGGQPLKPDDLKGWGPQATRSLSRWLGVEVGSDVNVAGNLLDRALSGNMSSDKFAEEATKQIHNVKMRQDLIANYHPGMSQQERTDIFRTVSLDQRAFDQNYIKVIGDRMSAIGSPPVLANVSASVFKAGDQTPITDKSSGNYTYAEVRPDQVIKAAQGLIEGKRDEVKNSIATWGSKSLSQVLAEYRDHKWPEELNNASAAVRAIGTPEYADQLRKIQSPELKTLVEKENADFKNGKSRNDIQYDFNTWQKQIYGAGVKVYSDALSIVQDREAKFVAQKQAAPLNSPNSPDPAAATIPSKAPPGSDIAKTAQVFAHQPYGNWPSLDGWSVENIAKLQIATNDQIRKDRDAALGIAMDAVDDRKRIDEIQNPVMRKIVDRDIAIGEPYEVIAKHIQEAAKSQTAAVNDRIQNATPGASPPPQRLSAPGGPGGV